MKGKVYIICKEFCRKLYLKSWKNVKGKVLAEWSINQKEAFQFTDNTLLVNTITSLSEDTVKVFACLVSK